LSSLFAKIAKVQSSLGDLVRDRTVNTGKYTYSYVTEDAITKALRANLTTLGVAVLVGYPEQWEVPDEDMVGVRCEITFADGETGETFTVSSLGWGSGGDKAGNKAMTSALRVGLCKTFLQAGDDDGESTHTPRRSRAHRPAPDQPDPDLPPQWEARMAAAVKALGSEHALQRVLAAPSGEIPHPSILNDDAVWREVQAKMSEAQHPGGPPSEVIKTRVTGAR
jgi:hypothetical protein